MNVYYTKSAPFKDHYILWFSDSIPFLVEVTNFMKQSGSSST